MSTMAHTIFFQGAISTAWAASGSMAMAKARLVIGPPA